MRDAALFDAADVREAGADIVDAGPPPDVRPTYLGTEFWAVSTTNSNLPDPNPFNFAIAVGNPSTAAVDITVTGGALPAPRRFSVAPGGAHTERLPWVQSLSNHSFRTTSCQPGCCDAECCEGGGGSPASAFVRAGAYRVQASSPVTVYQFNPLEFETRNAEGCVSRSYTNDASLLLPTPALGTEYLVLAHGTFAAFSFVSVVGTVEEPTQVTIVPSAAVTASIRGTTPIRPIPAGATFTFTITRGDVLQLVSDGAATDFTGTTVTATRPVAVFAGVDCTNISRDGSLGACDHLEEQLFPTNTWGTQVAVSALRDRGANEAYLLRVLASQDGTVVRFTPSWARPPATLRRGQYVEFDHNEDLLVEATAPVLVGQYMMGQAATPGATTGDPAMVLEVPTRQYRSDYVFVVPATYTTSFLQAVGPTNTTLLLDGNPWMASREFIESTPWTVHRARITPGTHRINSSDGRPFGIKVIGIAPYTSYMYPGGLDLAR
ncbi:MAG: IgGFc-binding protein [Myxococcales bacterium]|nr:IgGFc-binding protein [Myxococcales bacterium]